MLGAHPYPFAFPFTVSVVAAAPPRRGFAILGPAPPKLNPPAEMEVGEETLARLELLVLALSRRSRTLAIWISNLCFVNCVSVLTWSMVGFKGKRPRVFCAIDLLEGTYLCVEAMSLS